MLYLLPKQQNSQTITDPNFDRSMLYLLPKQQNSQTEIVKLDIEYGYTYFLNNKTLKQWAYWALLSSCYTYFLNNKTLKL